MNEQVSDLISKVLKSISPVMPQLKKTDPAEYVLKIGGKTEYITQQQTTVGSIRHVRKCIQTKQAVKFELVELSHIQSLLEDQETVDAIQVLIFSFHSN